MVSVCHVATRLPRPGDSGPGRRGRVHRRVAAGGGRSGNASRARGTRYVGRTRGILHLHLLPALLVRALRRVGAGVRRRRWGHRRLPLRLHGRPGCRHAAAATRCGRRSATRRGRRGAAWGRCAARIGHAAGIGRAAAVAPMPQGVGVGDAQQQPHAGQRRDDPALDDRLRHHVRIPPGKKCRPLPPSAPPVPRATPAMRGPQRTRAPLPLLRGCRPARRQDKAAERYAPRTTGVPAD